MNIRHDMTSGYINDREIDKQILEVAGTTAAEHLEEVKNGVRAFEANRLDSLVRGERTSSDEDELKLIRRLDKASQYEHHETRWQRQHEAAVKSSEVTNKMMSLASKYQARQIDDKQYFHKLAKLKAERDRWQKEI